MNSIFDRFPYLENDVVIIHKMEIKDIKRLDLMMKDPNVYKFEPTYLPEIMCGNAEDFIENECDNLFNAKENIVLGVYLKKDPTIFVGIAELYDFIAFRRKISIGVRLMKEVWNQGVGTNVISLLKNYILNDLYLKRITAHVIEENVGSSKALLKNGFVKRREVHAEDWGFNEPVLANKYVIYPEHDTI